MLSELYHLSLIHSNTNNNPHPVQVLDPGKWGSIVALPLTSRPQHRKIGAGRGEGIGGLEGQAGKPRIGFVKRFNRRVIAGALEIPFRAHHRARARRNFDACGEFDGLANRDISARAAVRL